MTPATTAAAPACSGDGLSPLTRFASVFLRTPPIRAQLAVLDLRPLDELDDERFDDVRPLPLLLLEPELELPPRLVPPVDRVELDFEAAALRLRPEDDELDPPRDEPDLPRDDELDEPDLLRDELEEPDPRREELDAPLRERSAWRLKRSVRERWLSSSSCSPSSSCDAKAKMSSTSEYSRLSS